MQPIKKQISSRYSIILVLILMTLGLNNLSFADSQNSKEQLQQQLDSSRKQYELNAMALTIIAPKISARPLNFFSGQTKKNQGRAILSSDYFQIGSNTKSFVAALLLKLQSDKILSLDDPITKWLPEYQKWNKVRIKHLLHNNSGLKSYTKNKAFLKAMDASQKNLFTPAQLVKYAYKEKVLFMPGAGWDYSNTNWILAGMIAEKACHHSISYLFKHYFLATEHLNLSNTLYAPYQYHAAIKQRLVHGYTDQGQDTIHRNMSWAASAGAMLASTEDLAYWAYDLFHKHALTAKELAEMQQLVSTTDGQDIPEGLDGYGLGIGLRRTEAGLNWGHEGHTEGYHSIFAYFPEDDITIAANAGGLNNSDFQDFVVKIVMILRNSQNFSDMNLK